MGRNTRQRGSQRVQRSKRTRLVGYGYPVSERELFILTSGTDPVPEWPDSGKGRDDSRR